MPYHASMKTETSRNDIYKAIANSLGEGWILRRILRRHDLWKVEEWCGSGEENMLSAAAAMLTVLGSQAFQDEILVLIANPNSKGTDTARNIEICKLPDQISKNISGLKYVSGFSFITDVVLPQMCNPSKVGTGARVWKKILGALPVCAKLTRASAHLLFVGSGVDEEVVDRNLQKLTSAECGTGIFPLLSSVKDLAKEKPKPYEVKLSAMGISDQMISTMNTHLDSISDDDVKAALKKTIMAMPWNRRVKVNRDLKSIRQKLDECLFGLEEAKQEVLAAIAGSLISGSSVFRPPNILLHGAPGTGKTAMAKAVAHALSMPFQSISMNGISTALSIVGLEPVWRSPQPGKIIQSMLDSKSMNPLILLDEIEKCGSGGEHGSPLDALLQALDPVQNRSFLDLYMGIPTDISEVFFIATANDISDLPEHLLDRFIVIEIPEYSLEEKQAIMPYLLKQITAERGLKENLHITSRALVRMEKQLLQKASLRTIKASLWRMLCEAALSSGNLTEFSRKLVIDERSVEAVLASNPGLRKKHGIGFL